MHNLEMTERGATLIYNRQQGSVWHRLGTPVEGEFAAECVSQAIGDWEVETSPLYHRVQNSGTDGKEFASFKMVPDQVVIRRSDNKVKIGMATKNYVPIQNRFGFKRAKQSTHQQECLGMESVSFWLPLLRGRFT